jgi:Rab GDP dissociation inhibitor
MDEEYDIVVLGTGLKECILSGLLSVNNYKVLHMDRNDYYGAESASLNLIQLYKKVDEDCKEGDIDKTLKNPRKYCIDMCPKFIMANGNLVKMLLGSKVTRYLDFKCVEGSFVYKDSKLFEVPVTPAAALKSGLMGMFQKRRYKNFLTWAMDVNQDDEKTWDKLNLKEHTMKQVYDYWRLDDNTIRFTGHAIALYPNDKYLGDKKKTIECLKKIQLYAHSLARYETSPYIYPIWGLGGLPEGFSRLAAVHGGTYMLRRPVNKINYGEDGKVVSVETSEGTAKVKKGGRVIADPSYFMDTLKDKKPMVRSVGKVARWLCIMDHPVPGTNNAKSCQIILPMAAKYSDIYISVQSNALSVTPKGMYTAMISSNVYTKSPKDELMVAYKLLGKVLKEFFFVSDLYMPSNDPRKDNVFIPSSMNATTHFEAATREVEILYKMITGKAVDLSANAKDIDKEDE